MGGFLCVSVLQVRFWVDPFFATRAGLNYYQPPYKNWIRYLQ